MVLADPAALGIEAGLANLYIINNERATYKTIIPQHVPSENTIPEQ